MSESKGANVQMLDKLCVKLQSIEKQVSFIFTVVGIYIYIYIYTLSNETKKNKILLCV